MNTVSLLADLEGGKFEIPCDSDVADDVHAVTVGEVDLLSIWKLHLKHVSSQLQCNLEKQERKACYSDTFFFIFYAMKLCHTSKQCFTVSSHLQNTSPDSLTLTSEPLCRGLCSSRCSSPQQPEALELHTSTAPSESSWKRGLKCSAMSSASQPRSIWNLKIKEGIGGKKSQYLAF